MLTRGAYGEAVPVPVGPGPPWELWALECGATCRSRLSRKSHKRRVISGVRTRNSVNVGHVFFGLDRQNVLGL